MKKCLECDTLMIDNIKVRGQHPFEIGVDGESEIYLDIPTGEEGKMFGIKFDKINSLEVKARLCPKCHKVEFYVDGE